MPTDAQRRNLASAHHAEVQGLKERIALLEQQLAEATRRADEAEMQHQMVHEWQVSDMIRAEILEKHLRNVLEIARTWQPDYATKMDIDTLQFAEDCADNKGAAATTRAQEQT
jgi:hypothetical protein